MFKALLDKTIPLTRELMEEQLWRGDTSLLSEYISEDAVWVSLLDHEQIIGKSNILQRFSGWQDQHFLLQFNDPRYSIVHEDENTCVVAGIYQISTRSETGDHIVENQAVTFVWSSLGGKLSIRHVHISSYPERDGTCDRLPFATTMLRSYFENIIEKQQPGRMTIADSKRILHVLDDADIFYLQADRNYTNIVRADNGEVVRIRQSISSFLRQYPGKCYAISRSIAVNLDYVHQLIGNDVIMVDGRTFKIPSRNITALKRALIERGS